ncbi:MAG: radical SAM family heme chaperone HemW, partial [Pseudomonadota bacterium]
MASLETEPPLGLYVHLPWCVVKCPYCDFNSHELRGELKVDAYTDALLTDWDSERERVQGRELSTVFFGGGTPSLFPAAAVARVLQATGVDSVRAEVTLEANPGAAEHDAFSAYRDAGVNRLSLGVQSFDDQKLRALGRVHDGAAARRAIERARRAGFENFNIDLMVGLPGQTLGDALGDLDQALAFEPTHVSHYQLTLEPGTPFS